MPQKPKDSAEIRDFPGLATQPDSLDVPQGAAVVQTNLQSSAQGTLESRPGARPVTFEEE